MYFAVNDILTAGHRDVSAFDLEPAGRRVPIKSPYYVTDTGIFSWYERRARDRKVASSNSGSSGGKIFFSRVNVVC